MASLEQHNMASLEQHKGMDIDQVKLEKQSDIKTGGIRKMNSICIWKTLATFFVVGNVIALYVLHFVNRPTPSTRYNLFTFVATDGTSPKEGDTVSMTSDGFLRNGAGTTAYLDTFTLSDSGAVYYEYIQFSRLGTSQSVYTTNLMSYRRNITSGLEGVLTTMTYTPGDKTFKVNSNYDATSNVLADQAIRGIATLSDTSAVVVSLADQGWPYITYVYPVTISGSDMKATIQQAKKVKVTENSATNFIAPLSSKSFVVAYYDEYVAAPASYPQRVKAGTVADDGTISFSSSSATFAPANVYGSITTTFGKPQVVPGATSGTFVIPYYSTVSDIAFTSDDKGLCLTMATFDETASTVSNFTSGSCNSKFAPVLFVKAIMVTNNLLAIAFHDSNNNNALTVALAYVTATTAYFRSSYVISEASGAFVFGTQWGFSPEPSMAVLSDNRLVVSFLNPSMNGQQSVKILKFSTQTMVIRDVSPVFSVAPSTFTLDISSGGVNKAITQELIPVTTDSVVAAYLGRRGITSHQGFSVVEAFGAPVGVLQKYKKHSKSNVVFAGKAGKISTMEGGDIHPGVVYYATSAGYAVPFAGDTSAGYFMASSKVLVTTDSKFGVGIDADTLYVSTTL